MWAPPAMALRVVSSAQMIQAAHNELDQAITCHGVEGGVLVVVHPPDGRQQLILEALCGWPGAQLGLSAQGFGVSGAGMPPTLL